MKPSGGECPHPRERQDSPRAGAPSFVDHPLKGKDDIRAQHGNGIYGHANTTANAWGSAFSMPNRQGKARVLAIKFG